MFCLNILDCIIVFQFSDALYFDIFSPTVLVLNARVQQNIFIKLLLSQSVSEPLETSTKCNSQKVCFHNFENVSFFKIFEDLNFDNGPVEAT